MISSSGQQPCDATAIHPPKCKDNGTSKAVQVVRGSYYAYSNDQVADVPVAVYSLAGASRKGKSLRLKLFLRYLGSQKQGNVDVFLIDTQEAFDSSTSVKGCSLELSTMISSEQMQQIQDTHEYLGFFTDYGKAAHKCSSLIGKPFQEQPYYYLQRTSNHYLLCLLLMVNFKRNKKIWNQKQALRALLMEQVSKVTEMGRELGRIEEYRIGISISKKRMFYEICVTGQSQDQPIPNEIFVTSEILGRGKQQSLDIDLWSDEVDLCILENGSAVARAKRGSTTLHKQIWMGLSVNGQQTNKRAFYLQ